MRGRLAVFLIGGVGLVFGLLFARQMYVSRGLPRASFETKKLRVLTYSTFVSAAGPGHEIIERFKKEHSCEVEVTIAGDAGLLLERMRLTQDRDPFDVVLGLDQFMLASARVKGQWREVTLPRGEWQKPARLVDDAHFTPFDWSPMAFVYRQGEIEPPRALEDLLDPRFHAKIALQDPRSSSPGLQFFHWIEGQIQDPAAFFARLKPNVQSISPSWAFSYGVFKKKQAGLVFSYLTSLAYHWGFDHDRGYQVAVFAQGHPVQVEYVAVPATCAECMLAEAFVRELMTPASQKTIMEKNFMLPVLPGLEKGTVFAELPVLKTLNAVPSDQKTLHDWDQTFKH